MKNLAIRYVGALAVMAGSVPALAASYNITDLGTLGGSASVSLNINNRGQVVGGSTTSGDMAFHAFIGQPGGGLQDLGAKFGGTNSQALAINENGDVAGSTVISGNISAVLYNGTVTQLATLGGVSSVARGINNKSDVVGYSALSGNSAAHAFLFTHGNMLDLGTLGGTNSSANAINNRGDVVGSSETSTPGVTQAFLFSSGALRNLGTLGGQNSTAFAINASERIVGNADKADGTTHAFVFSDGAMGDLGTLGGNNSRAFGINDNGEIVGAAQFTLGDVTMHAFYSDGCQLTDLNSVIPAQSGWVLGQALAINNAGQIVGVGQLNGQTHAFVLTPNQMSATTGNCSLSKGGVENENF